jgi:adenylate cyclase
MSLSTYIPQDRRRALALAVELPPVTTGAALLADISGFTALTEQLTQTHGERRGIEELSLRINAAYETLIAEVDRCGGSVIGFSGDAITCWFDQAVPHPCQRALACGLAMQSSMQAYSGLALKVAVASGPARRLVVGDPDIQLIDVVAGATPMRAALGEGLAQPGEVLADAATAQALNLCGLTSRTGPNGEAFVVVPLSWRAEQALPDLAVAFDTTASPPPQALRPWLLPFVWERESAGQGLFATDLRPAAALFVRFGGLDYDHDPAAAGALQSLVAHTQSVCRRHGGVLLELTIGDKGSYLYASFGAAQAHEDDARRALRAALALRDFFDTTPYAAQMGLSMGTLRVGAYGANSRRSFGAMGDEVNFAARLMALAQPGEILISGRLRQALAGDYALQARPPVFLKGKAEPMPVFAVLGQDRKRAIRLQEPAFALPMVGRDAELAQVEALLGAALAGRGQVVAVCADAGMGKSRLLAEIIRLARRQGFVGYGGACESDGSQMAYQVWQPIWQALLDLDLAWPQRKRTRWVQAQVQELASEHADAWPLLDAVLGLDLPDNSFTQGLQPKDRKAVLEQLLVRCLAASAREVALDGGALLLVLEDLHAADVLSVDLLVQLAQASAELPVLVLLSYRPPPAGADAATGDHPGAVLVRLQNFVQIDLDGLLTMQAEQVLRGKLAQLYPQRTGAVPAALIARITQQAQGNPFYVEELLGYLHDRGIDPRNPGALEAVELPASLHSLVLSRIDALPVAQQLTLKGASIIGRLFRAAELHGYCPAVGAEHELKANLQQLDSQGFTPLHSAEPDLSYLFKHLVTLEVGHQSLPHATRMQLHGLYARYLEARDAEHQALRVPELAHHFALAQMADKACHYLRLAGEQAAAGFANEQALQLFERALQWMPLADVATPADVAARADVMLRREAVQEVLGQNTQREQELLALQALLEQRPDLPQAADLGAQACIRRGRVAIDVGDYAAAQAHAQDAIQRLHTDGGVPSHLQPTLVDALSLLARALFFVGQVVAARPPLERALALARQAGYTRGEYIALSQTGLLHWHLGEPAASEASLQQALVLIEAAGDLRFQIQVLNNRGLVARGRGHLALALAHFEQARQIAQRIGSRSAQAMLLNNMGGAALLAGDLQRAAASAEQAAAAFAEVKEPAQQGMALITLGEAQRELGQLPQALQAATQALALLRASGHARGQALVLENIGTVHMALGQYAQATEFNAQSRALARDMGARAYEASALHQWGRIQAATGAAAGARQTLLEAAALAQEVQDERLGMEVRAALAELALQRSTAPASPVGSGAGAVPAPEAGHDEEAVAQALQHVQPLVQQLMPEWTPQQASQPTSQHNPDQAPSQPGETPLYLPMFVHLAAVRTLLAAADPHAAMLLAQARRELQRRADAIDSPALRQSFLAMAEHRVLLQL